MNEISLPNYEVVPLRSEEITVAAVQMATKLIDVKTPKPGIKKNLENALDLIDYAAGMQHADLIVLPEMAIQGFGSGWDREDWLRIAFDVPGEEMEQIAAKAKQYNCYVVVCCYTKNDKDWPGHYFNSGIIIDPRGEVILDHWKARWAPQLAAYCTTVHDVLDEFVERYGWDAVWPVARTDIGNIGVFICSEGFQPETSRALAFKGAEILARPCGGCAGIGSHFTGYRAIVGDIMLGMRAQCQFNNCYGVLANTAWLPHIRNGAGGSMIIDGYGRVIKAAEIVQETVVSERIPIALFRNQHSIPLLRQEIYAPVYQEYVGKYPPNLFSKYLPKDSADNLRCHTENARW